LLILKNDQHRILKQDERKAVREERIAAACVYAEEEITLRATSLQVMVNLNTSKSVVTKANYWS